MSAPAELVAALYDDPEECARVAKLRYVNTEEPGFVRMRCGRGFTYRDADGRTVADVEIRNRIKQIAIPPAWKNVWVCSSDDGHILAVGEDDRGRRQYIYHERWRELRDQLNFHRLVGFGEVVPAVRTDVERQLRRRTFDVDRVMAAMLRIIDVTGLRIGNEVYAEENDSYGLTTLTKRHVQLDGSSIAFRFRAKSGLWAALSMTDPGVARVLEVLLAQRGRWLFAVDGKRIGADEVNARLAELTGVRVTAKDFRTWHGTTTAFRYLRAHLPAGSDPDAQVLAAIDAAAASLGNTRAIARAHYVHPDVIAGYTSGELERYLSGRRARAVRGLDADEALLHDYLVESLSRFSLVA